MTPVKQRTDLAVLLLHNVDSSWEVSEIAALNEAVSAMTCALMKEGHPVVEVPVTHGNLEEILKPFSPENYIVFNWCEELPGIPHSDVMVTEILENLKFAYTGASPQVLSLSWDKAAVKILLNQNKIPLPRWRLFSTSEPEGWDCFPAIVKPAYEHCSFGISAEAVVMNTKDLMKRISFVWDTFKQPAIVEDFIDGREFHVTLWGNSDVEMLPPAEMDFAAFKNLRDRLCTFDSKFKPGSLHYENIDMRIPAKLTAREIRRLKKTALQTYQATGCRDYARIDLRLREGVFYVLDVNPNADISPETSMVYAAETVGLTYGDVGSRLINLAARRHPVLTGGQMKQGIPRLQAVRE
jgi:D-alanine-D-alanine ligase